MQTRVYRLKSVAPDRVDSLVKSMLGETSVQREYYSAVDRDAQMLVVSATPRVHEHIAQMIAQMDTPMAQAQNPMQFYKLKNTKAQDVLSTISGLLAEAGTATVRPSAGPSASTTAPPAGGITFSERREQAEAAPLDDVEAVAE